MVPKNLNTACHKACAWDLCLCWTSFRFLLAMFHLKVRRTHEDDSLILHNNLSPEGVESIALFRAALPLQALGALRFQTSRNSRRMIP